MRDRVLYTMYDHQLVRKENINYHREGIPFAPDFTLSQVKGGHKKLVFIFPCTGKETISFEALSNFHTKVQTTLGSMPYAQKTSAIIIILNPEYSFPETMDVLAITYSSVDSIAYYVYTEREGEFESLGSWRVRRGSLA